MNDIYVGALFSGSYLEHHGIKGMRWGVRKYQNEDGTLTDAGKKRYKTKTNFEKQTARDRRIRRNVVKGVKTAATAGLTAIDSDSSEPYYFDISPDNLLTVMLSVESGDYEKHLAFEGSV